MAKKRPEKPKSREAGEQVTAHGKRLAILEAKIDSLADHLGYKGWGSNEWKEWEKRFFETGA